ncbi:MAG TPA: hypothetical protein VE291_00620 [Terracidiphilus sp.]|jgi:hypothetical protein|nr:hypothetical protein [Terracidiphilus sp.]
MKFAFSRAFAAAALATACAALAAQSQTPAQIPAPPATPAQTPQPAPTGKVIFSRSTDENGDTATQAGPAAIEKTTEPVATDDDRLAVTFTSLDLDVRLQPAAQHIDVRAVLTVRNDGKSPLSRIPLQISSALRWEQVRLNGRGVAFPVATLNSDTDHTGQLHEAAVPLATPLAPGASVQLDAVYSGQIALSAQRLITINTPETLALHSDWDEIAPGFTGLRGFGNVVWYPVASVPVILGDGARLFDEIGRHKLRLVGARFALRLTVEFPHGQPPTVALVNGVSVPLTVSDAQGLDPELTGVATAALAPTTLGFVTPSLFVATRTQHAAPAVAGTMPSVVALTTPDNQVAVQTWLEAASTVAPFVARWLGARPRAPLTLLDLPDPEDAPWESGPLLATNLGEGPADRIQSALVHALARAYAPAAPAWLSEGQATFVESLWVEKQQGRDRALGMLEADRAALALAEPSSPGESAGTPLAQAIAPIYYRTKAAYVLWMFRDTAGDDALAASLSACDAAKDGSGYAVGAAAPCPLAQLLKQNAAIHDSGWIFSDWIDADKGLPDLSIDSEFPAPSPGGTYLVAVNVSNAGYAAAEVPITIRTAKGEDTERILVPARGKATDRILVAAPPTQVQLNDGAVPEIEASVHVTDITNIPAAAPPSTGPTPHKLPRDGKN